jgi:hypothetical protein
MERIRETHSLVGLRVGYSDGPEPVLTCTVDSPDDETLSWDVTAREIGLDADPRRAGQRFDAGVRLDPIADRLSYAPAVLDLRARHGALWLNLTDDHPLLPALDWESGLGLPVLRLPAHLTPPAPPPSRPRVALCASMPVAKSAYEAVDLVGRAFSSMRQALGTLPEVHVFADAALFAELSAEFGDIAAIHDPHAEGPHDPAGQPWLAWIGRTLGPRSFDVLHLIGHGYLGADQGAFAVCEAPDQNFDRVSARFIWPQQLCRMLSRCGVWGVICTAAPRNFSRAGLRLLADRTAAVRAAATIFHDAAHAAPDALDDAYRLLLRHPTAPPSNTAGLTVRAHPARFGIAQVQTGYQPGRTELAELVDSGADLPGALIGAQREIRQMEAQLSFDSSAPRVLSARSGLETAKARLDDILRQSRGGPQ